MGGDILSTDHVGSSHILASKQLKVAQKSLFWQFLPISHSVDQFFDKITVNIWGKVISVQIHLDPAILEPQNSSKY